jgi:hypothetical protein
VNGKRINYIFELMAKNPQLRCQGMSVLRLGKAAGVKGICALSSLIGGGEQGE